MAHQMWLYARACRWQDDSMCRRKKRTRPGGICSKSRVRVDRHLLGSHLCHCRGLVVDFPGVWTLKVGSLGAFWPPSLLAFPPGPRASVLSDAFAGSMTADIKINMCNHVSRCVSRKLAYRSTSKRASHNIHCSRRHRMCRLACVETVAKFDTKLRLPNAVVAFSMCHCHKVLI